MDIASQAEKEFKDAASKTGIARDDLRKTMAELLKKAFNSTKVLGLALEDGSLGRFIDSAVGAFFDQDLLQSVRMFLANAKGSFGLFVSCSLDAHRQFVVAARGQTISLAFYPKQNLVLWGSEQA